MTTGQRIRKRRIQLGWTLQALSEEIGRSTNAILAWECDERMPPKTMQKRLFEILGLTFGRIGAKPEKKQRARQPERAPELVEGPCIAYSCPMQRRCQAMQHACEDFLTFVRTGCAHPPINPRPTRAIYLQVFDTKDED